MHRRAYEACALKKAAFLQRVDLAFRRRMFLLLLQELLLHWRRQ